MGDGTQLCASRKQASGSESPGCRGLYNSWHVVPPRFRLPMPTRASFPALRRTAHAWSRHCVRAAILVTTLSGTVACREPTAGQQGPSREEGWRADLQYLDTLVPRMHPPTANDPGFATFHAAIASLNASVPSSSDEAIGAGIQKLLVALGNGHTTVIPDDVGPMAFKALMVDFYWFDDGVYIVSVRPGLGQFGGARVTAIGGVPVEQVMTRIMPFVPRDNAQSGRWLGAQLMQYTSVLRAAGIPADDNGTPFTLQLATGGTTTASIAAHDRAALARLHPPGGVTTATPRYLRDHARAYWLDSLPADRTLYVNFNSVRDDATETLAAFAARVDALLKGGAYSSVIVDVRLNNGGNNTLLAPLLAALDAFDAASASHRIYALIGRSTFSAAQNFVTRLEATTRVVFAGEATGGRPNHIGDQSDTPLPYSRLRVSIASRLYEDAGPGDRRDAIEPHLSVPILAADYFANRDPVFDAVMTAIRQQGGR